MIASVTQYAGCPLTPMPHGGQLLFFCSASFYFVQFSFFPSTVRVTFMVDAALLHCGSHTRLCFNSKNRKYTWIAENGTQWKCACFCDSHSLYLSVEYQVLPPTSSVWTEIRSRQPQDVIASSYIVIKPLLKGYDYFVVGMYVIYYQI